MKRKFCLQASLVWKLWQSWNLFVRVMAHMIQAIVLNVLILQMGLSVQELIGLIVKIVMAQGRIIFS
ncbi:MAG: hypothetical protein EGQ00_01075 [Parabacteroides johnsonii]|nr:hypothetical protein [Parabacteroides johnsonii]